MHKVFTDFFESENITVYGEISAENLRIIQPHLMPDGIKSAIVWLIPYYTGPHPDRNISLYAVSKDYHLYSRSLGSRLCEVAKAAFPNDEFYSFCDSSPVNEVAAAITAGLGVLGKNRLLINETYGSFVFVGCLLSTLEADTPKNVPLKNCVGCGKCVASCDFFCGKSDVCKSELNQRKELTDSELEAVRSEKIRWGCDVCQQVCPMNKDVPLTPISFFYEDIIENVTPELLSEMPKSEFKQRAFAWRGKKTILRNVSENSEEN